MIKIITWINFGLFIAGITSLGYVYVKRTEFVNDMLFGMQEQIIKNIQYDLKMQMPSTTGSAFSLGK